jgi:MFS family permease
MSAHVSRAQEEQAHQSFASLRHSGYRAFFLGSATAMLADSIEHVISYWVVFQKFHSPALGGFAVISHWLPFLLFSVHVGALADRFDPRRIIQLGMILFMFVSVAWATLFITDALQMWHAMALLVVHGAAGVLWNPPAQTLIHDIVSPQLLPSAVRLTATARYLGLLMGPAVGAGLLLALGPSKGLFVNVLLYLPLTLWLWRAPYGPRFRETKIAPRAMRGFADVLATVRSVFGNVPIVSMTILAGAASLFVGNGYQAQMPGFAFDLGHGDPGMSYSMLLAADAAGALSAGFVLESRQLLVPAPRTACILAMLWCCALGSFAMTRVYPLAVVLLFTAGFLELSFNTMAQTLVQLCAPEAIRGRVIGLYSMTSLGFRTFSGVSVGLAGSLIGIHRSLALSAAVVFIVTGVLVAVTGRMSLRAGQTI